MPGNQTLLRLHDTRTWELKSSIETTEFPWRTTFSADGQQVGLVGGDHKSEVAYFGLYSVPEDAYEEFKIESNLSFLSTVYVPRFEAFANSFGAALQLFKDSNSVSYGFMAPKDLSRYECHAPMREMAFLQEGKRVAIGQGRGWENRHEPGQLAVWETRDWTNSVRVANQETPSINTLDVSPDGKWVFSGGVDHAVTMWGAKDLTPRAVLLGHGHGISCVRVAPDGKTLATAGFDGRIILWDISQLDRFLRGERVCVSATPRDAWEASGVAFAVHR